jgi:glycosyltransferase involved in cell wall biosynthesis
LVPNAGGIVDYVLDGINGYICQTEARDYREKVMRVRDNPEHRQQMALQALTYARQRSWEDTMAELERLYTEAYELHRARQRHQSSSASG